MEYEAIVAKTNKTLSTFQKCFHLAFNLAEDNTKNKIMQNFVRILKEETEDIVSTYELVFFKANYLQNLSEEERNLVKEHLFAKLGVEITQELLESLSGITNYIDSIEINKLIHPILQIIYQDQVQDLGKSAIRFIENEYNLTANEVIKIEIKSTVKYFEEHWNNHKSAYYFDEYEPINPFKPILQTFELFEDIPF